MEKSRFTPLLLISGGPFTQNVLAQQLRTFLPRAVPIIPYILDEKKAPLEGQFFAVFSSREVFREFMEKENDRHLESYIIAERTMLNDNIDRILALPRNQRILLVNESQESTEESISHLRSIGFDFLNLIPYYPGCTPPDNSITIAVTPGEIDKVPQGIEAVYDIGPRTFDFTTIVRILSYYGLLEDVIPDYADRYLHRLLDFAKKFSNVADETSRSLPTLRAELIGRGYFAKYHFDDIKGKSKAILDAKAIAEKIARTDLTVLIEGDNGTGKELFASAIHNASDRRRKPFVAINLSALPDQLAESELFGYEEGAFTGARKHGKAGLFQQAAGGTVFLDEIGDISPKMQAKLLRVLQEKEIMRVGGDRIIPVEVRIIAASNRDLRQMIKEKTFRKDLYYRLNEGYLHLPSLAERKEDIPLLISHWQKKMFHSDKVFDPEAMELLMNHDWPGNVRELLNMMKFTFAVCGHHTIVPSDLTSLYHEELADEISAVSQPQSLSSKSCEESIKPSSFLDSASLDVLHAIKELQHMGQIAGRTAVGRFLKDCGRPLSEYRIRKCLDFLLDCGLTSAKEGHYGYRLSSKGAEVLLAENR